MFTFILISIFVVIGIFLCVLYFCKRRRERNENLRDYSNYQSSSSRQRDISPRYPYEAPRTTEVQPRPPSTRATVIQPPPNPTLLTGYVASAEEELAIVQTDGTQCLYWELDEESECVTANKPFPKLHDEILIKGMELEPDGYITKYDVIPFNSYETGEEFAVVVDLPAPGVISIISRSMPQPTLTECSFKVNRHDLVMGTVKRLRPHFKPRIHENEYWIIKDAKENPSQTGVLCMFDVRKLDKNQSQLIETNCRNVENLSLYHAEKYIRDIYIAISWLDLYLQNEIAWEYTVEAQGGASIDGRTAPSSYMITIYLTKKQANKCIFTQSTETWRVGTELSMRHPDLSSFAKNSVRQHEGGMIVEAITKHNEEWTRVDLKPAPRSKDLFDLLRRSHSTEPLSVQDQNGKRCLFTVGPSIDDRNTIAEKEQDSVSKGRICVSASTNTAITNALDVTHRFFENITKIRQFSKTAEGQVSGASKQISLVHMAQNAGRYVDLHRNPNLAESVKKYEIASQGLQTEISRRNGMQKVAGKESASSNLKQTFFEAYCPFLIGSTCEMVARRSTDKERRIAQEMKEGRRPKMRECVTHLILDEASQLPPHMALAVYVALPTVEKITVIGDTRQLGPFSKLDEGSFAHKMVGIGELERLNRNNCTNRTELTTIYRCHPRIMDIMMKPIYGSHLTSGTAEEDRDLAYAADLPVARDWNRSPALFVNVDGNCVNGYNQKEAEVVLSFINFLKGQGITGENVAVICNHKAQREKIAAKLKGKGNFGIMKTSVAIHTIDSFQGKEAKVVLVLTTKTCGPSQNPKKTLSFVSHPNRGTVAVSRAQHAVYVFGQWEKLAQTEFWKQFVPSIVENKALVDSNWNPASEQLYLKLINGPGRGIDKNGTNMQNKKKNTRTVVNSANKKNKAQNPEAQKKKKRRKGGSKLKNATE